MTPRERVAYSMSDKRPDKLPLLVINSNTFICQYYGISVEDFLTKPALCAECYLKFIEEFKFDYAGVATAYILYGCGPELGVQWQFVGRNFPGSTEGPLKSHVDLSKIKVPSEPSGYFKCYLESLKLVNDALADTHHLLAVVLGPFSTACFLRGIEETFIDTIMKPDFFKAYMERCTELSVYFGRNVLSTGIRNPILLEIFLNPGTIKPDTYFNIIEPYDLEVQRQLEPKSLPNTLGVFMGEPNDRKIQKEMASFYNAYYGLGESVEAIKKAVRYRIPGFPFPVSISGRALKSWNTKKIISFLKEAVDFLVEKERLFPAINLASIQAESPEDASDIADKLTIINHFRDEYQF